MEALRWPVGLLVSLVFGGIVTLYYARRVMKLIGDEDPNYRILIPLSIGSSFLATRFFTIWLLCWRLDWRSARCLLSVLHPFSMPSSIVSPRTWTD